MNVTVYCGANPGKDREFTELAKELGRWIGEKGHRLVYGGGHAGLMGVVADAVLATGGEVIGVIPNFLKEMERAHPGLTELIVTEEMAERRNIMLEKGEMFVALPGGLGTLDEISEVMSRIRLGLNKGRCVLINKNGFYDPLKALVDNMFQQEFITDWDYEHIHFVETVDEIDK